MRGGRNSREAWRPTGEQIALVRLGYKAGDSRAEIAATLGISLDMLDRHRAAGSFGPLPTRRGHGGGRRANEAKDTPDRLFGVERPEWESRQAAVRSTWPDGERMARARGLLPNDTDKTHGERLGRMAANPASHRIFTDKTRSRTW